MMRSLLQPVSGYGRKISGSHVHLAYAMGAMAEFSALLIRPLKKINPKFSRFAVTYTCSDFTFSSDKAVKDFGFKPKYSEAEAFRRTVEYYK